MTDKQIIIDVCPYQSECSVSGCKRNDDDCFVRQLFEERNRAENQIVELNKMVEAKEQECERLRFPMPDTNYAILTKEEFEQLKAENEELKEINQELMKYRKHSITCQECYEDGLEDGKTSNKELRKLRKTLAEIKEIAEKDFNHTCWQTYEKQLKQILQKCEELDE